jgi:hypothetical protein
VFNQDLDAKNSESFFAYTDPAQYKKLIHQKIRKVGSFKKITAINQIREIHPLFGHHDTYAVNYQGKSSGWSTRTAGWNNRGFPIHPFRHIDFLNTLLGTYSSGTAIALSDKHQDYISNIRIDYDFDSYSGDAAVRLAKEIQEKLALIGFDCFFLATGNRGLQAIIPLPSGGRTDSNALPRSSILEFWRRLKPYLDTDIAIQDKCSLDSFLRLPLGIHASSNNLSLYFSPDTEAYVSHLDQLSYFKNSWQWQHPIHISNAIDGDAFGEQVEQGFTFVPDPKTIHTVVKPSQSKLPRNNDWASKVWEMRLQLKPGMWQNYLLENDAIHAAYALFGDKALEKLEELATQIPTNQPSDIQGRIKVVKHLWEKFNPVHIPKDSSKTLTLLMTTKISADTYAEADLLFKYLQHQKTSTIRWVNENANDYILAVLHGINCCDNQRLTLTIDELLIFLEQILFSSMVRRTLVSIIQKTTQDPPRIRTINKASKVNQKPAKNNPLAIFTYEPGYKIFNGATPGTFSKVPGLKHKAIRLIDVMKQ